MRLFYTGIAMGITSILISTCWAIWTPQLSEKTIWHDVLACVNWLASVLGLILCLIANKRNPSNATAAWSFICIIAILWAIASPYYISAR